MASKKKAPETTHFLNVDLDIRSNSNLEPLVAALGKRVINLATYRSKRTYYAYLELSSEVKSADAAIRAFCRLIESLPDVERNLWNSAKIREFNIGVQSGDEPHSFGIALEERTVKSAAEVGARIALTLYGRIS